MHQAGLKPIGQRQFTYTAESKNVLPIATKELARQFSPAALNSAYVSDIIYMCTGTEAD
jgi:putative transposase